jgi:Uma2 family endonuclease
MSVEVAEALYEAVFAHPGTWTEDEYFALPEMPTKVELVDGVLVVNPLPDAVHQRLVMQIGLLFVNTCPTREWEVFPGLNVRLWPGHVRNPDVIVARAGATSLYVPAADMLVLVEITSPGNFRQDRIAKHRDYAAAGVPFYLRVDLENGPENLEATLFELVDSEYREAARSVDGVLRSTKPWPFEADLRALATGRSTA